MKNKEFNLTKDYIGKKMKEMTSEKKKRITRTYEGKEILCSKCKTREFRSVVGYPKDKYGVIVVHKKNCKYIRKLLKG